jgi:AcrR family transcriptional regulator
VEEAGTTKGSVFHHFDGKNALGYAVIDELLYAGVNEQWFKPLQVSTDPVTDIKKNHQRRGDAIRP